MTVFDFVQLDGSIRYDLCLPSVSPSGGQVFAYNGTNIERHGIYDTEITQETWWDPGFAVNGLAAISDSEVVFVDGGNRKVYTSGISTTQLLDLSGSYDQLIDVAYFDGTGILAILARVGTTHRVLRYNTSGVSQGPALAISTNPTETYEWMMPSLMFFIDDFTDAPIIPWYDSGPGEWWVRTLPLDGGTSILIDTGSSDLPSMVAHGGDLYLGAVGGSEVVRHYYNPAPATETDSDGTVFGESFFDLLLGADQVVTIGSGEEPYAFVLGSGNSGSLIRLLPQAEQVESVAERVTTEDVDPGWSPLSGNYAMRVTSPGASARVRYPTVEAGTRALYGSPDGVEQKYLHLRGSFMSTKAVSVVPVFTWYDVEGEEIFDSYLSAVAVDASDLDDPGWESAEWLDVSHANGAMAFDLAFLITNDDESDGVDCFIDDLRLRQYGSLTFGSL